MLLTRHFCLTSYVRSSLTFPLAFPLTRISTHLHPQECSCNCPQQGHSCTLLILALTHTGSFHEFKPFAKAPRKFVRSKTSTHIGGTKPLMPRPTLDATSSQQPSPIAHDASPRTDGSYGCIRAASAAISLDPPQDRVCLSSPLSEQDCFQRHEKHAADSVKSSPAKPATDTTRSQVMHSSTATPELVTLAAHHLNRAHSEASLLKKHSNNQSSSEYRHPIAKTATKDSSPERPRSVQLNKRAKTTTLSSKGLPHGSKSQEPTGAKCPKQQKQANARTKLTPSKRCLTKKHNGIAFSNHSHKELPLRLLNSPSGSRHHALTRTTADKPTKFLPS